jgi:hypothetical protein
MTLKKQDIARKITNDCGFMKKGQPRYWSNCLIL